MALSPTTVTGKHKTGTLSQLNLFDPERLHAPLPQPYRLIVKVLDSIFDSAWSIVEERHPEVILTLDGTRRVVQRDLSNVSGPKAVCAVKGDVSALAWKQTDEDSGYTFAGTSQGVVDVFDCRGLAEGVPNCNSVGSVALGSGVSVVAMSAVQANSDVHLICVATGCVATAGPPAAETEPTAAVAAAPAKGKDAAASSRAINAAPVAPVVRAETDFVSVVELSEGGTATRVSCLHTFSAAYGRIASLQLSPDGEWLAVVYTKGAIALHRVPKLPQSGFAIETIDEADEVQETEARTDERATQVELALAHMATPHFILAEPTLRQMQVDRPDVLETAIHFTSAGAVLVRRNSSNVLEKFAIDVEDGDVAGAAAGEVAPRQPQKPRLLAEWLFPATITASSLTSKDEGTSEASLVVIGLFSGSSILWDIRVGVARCVLKRHKAAVAGIALHKRRYAAIAGVDGRVHFYDLLGDGEAALVACRMDLQPRLGLLAALSDGRGAPLALAVDGVGNVALYNVAVGAVVGCLRSGDEPPGFAPKALAHTADVVVLAEAPNSFSVFPLHDALVKLVPAVAAELPLPSEVISRYARLADPNLKHVPHATHSVTSRTSKTSRSSRPTLSLDASGTKLGKSSAASLRSAGSQSYALTENNLLGLDNSTIPKLPQIADSHFIDVAALVQECILDSAIKSKRRQKDLASILGNMAKLG
ncbi:hypothetical protein M885DRAFT_610567 [Pelagophyceae sp. CCMP2097]|nr:hypothetical protein M885DRAFT_610567 [Pelagophyceae sp. CCMP2097]